MWRAMTIQTRTSQSRLPPMIVPILITSTASSENVTEEPAPTSEGSDVETETVPLRTGECETRFGGGNGSGNPAGPEVTFLAPFQRTRANLEWLEPKWTQVRPSKFERLYKHKLCFSSVNELESVLLFVIEETVMDDFKDPNTKDINYKVLLNALLMPFFQLRTRILEKYTYFEIGDI